MRVAVTGAGGRLGRAVVAALADAPFTGPAGPAAWGRADFDLDAPGRVTAVLERDRPEVVVHAAAWTDVDGCAREPHLAMQRNGIATGELAAACASRGIDLLVVSTNEVFDGTRVDGQPYAPSEATNPANPYGASKLAGERAAFEAYAGPKARGVVGIARTAWLFGPGAPDFPTKILVAAAQAAAAGSPLRVVADEWGSPTYVADVADAIVELLADDALGGVHHLVDGGIASRAEWAADVLARAGLGVTLEPVGRDTWERTSRPPAWGVLAATPLPSGEPMRDWRLAMADYAPTLLRTWQAA